MIHRAIKGFEDYLVTNTGRVYSLKSQKQKNGVVREFIVKEGK